MLAALGDCVVSESVQSVNVLNNKIITFSQTTDPAKLVLSTLSGYSFSLEPGKGYSQHL